MLLVMGAWIAVCAVGARGEAAPAFAVAAIKASGPASGNGMSIKFFLADDKRKGMVDVR
jgi:hypothetical protein